MTPRRCAPYTERVRLALLLLAACGGGTETPDAGPIHGDLIDVDGFDVVVGSTWVFVFPLHTGLHNFDLPAIGMCGSFDSDAVTAVGGNLGEVSMAGVPLSQDPAGSSNPFASYTVGVTAATTLHAVDAGRAIDVQIDAPPYPSATNLAVSAMGVATWDASGVDSFFAAYSGGFGTTGCRLDGATRSHDFGGALEATIYVEAFAAPKITQTELGPVRVFYGDVAMVTP